MIPNHSGILVLMLPAGATASVSDAVPPTVISAAVIFVISTVISWLFRYRDREQKKREQRLDAVVQLLSSIRHIIGLEASQARNWAGRAEAEDKMHASYVLLKSRAPGDQQPVLDWVRAAMDAIQYDIEWQDPERFQQTIADPLFAWIEYPELKTWFSERLETSPLRPIPFDQASVPVVSGRTQRFLSWGRRNLHG